jgi:hypothetical protein
LASHFRRIEGSAGPFALSTLPFLLLLLSFGAQEQCLFETMPFCFIIFFQEIRIGAIPLDLRSKENTLIPRKSPNTCSSEII